MKTDRPQQRAWMSLDDADEGKGPERSEGGFVELGALGRRGFLKALGVSGAVSLAACERLAVTHAVPLLVPTEEIVPGVPVHYASTCMACSAGCGTMVTVRDGRPVKMEGLKTHPVSKGGLCALGQGQVRGLYDAGRLRAPSMDGKQSSWQAVDNHVRGRLAELQSRGLEVVVLSRTVHGPAERKAIEAFLTPYSGRHVEYDAGLHGSSAVIMAYEQLDGRGVLPSIDIGAADFVLAIGSDFLTNGPEPVAHTADYAARRGARASGRSFRHVQVEGGLSLSGAAADERHQANAFERRQLVFSMMRAIAGRTGGDAAALAGALFSGGASAGPMESKAQALVAELLKNASKSLLLCGAADVGTQLAVALINRMLGNEGRTLRLDEPSMARRGRDEGVIELLSSMEAGKVGALIILDQNPVEELPDGGRFAELLKKVPLTVALTDRPNATTAAVGVVAAAHHALERWGDAALRPSLLTVAQPTVRPLFETRHPLESLLVWGGAQETDFRKFMKSTWQAALGMELDPMGFEAQWSKSLSAGLAPAAVARQIAGPASQPVLALAATPDALRSLIAAPGPVSGGEGLEVELIEEVGLRDGKVSFNPWLRELPDPLTRTSWTAVARLAPALARSKGIEDGDFVQIDVAGTKLRFAAKIMPGQHPKVIGLPVGYGVKDGDGGIAERNAFRVRGKAVAAQIQKTGERMDLPMIQTHPSSEGRPIIFQVASDGDHVEAGHHGPLFSLWDDRHAKPDWHMVIDLDACTGCSACVVACQAENNTNVVGPDQIQLHRDMYWLRMDRYFMGEEDNPDVLFEPMMCNQCDNAPCETVCPVAATVHSTDGLNQQAYNRCVGTRYCANNCPYKARRFNWLDYTPKDPVERLALNPDVVVRERGIMEKCTFCVQRIQYARIEAKKKGQNQEAPHVETACQQSCPAQAIRFGDGSDAHGEIGSLRHKPRAFQVLAELGILPSITYLARVRNRQGHGNGGGHS